MRGTERSRRPPRLAIAALLVLAATSPLAAPPYVFRVLGVLDAGVASPSPPLQIQRLFPDGGVASAGESPLSIAVYAPVGADLVLNPWNDTGVAVLPLSIAGNSAVTSPFHVRLPSVGNFVVAVDAGANAVTPFQFTVESFPLSHRAAFDTDYVTAGEFHDYVSGDSRATHSWSAAAAREGDGGYAFQMAAPSASGSGFGSWSQRYYLGRFGDLYVRTWVRTTASNGLGEVNLFNTHAYGTMTSPLADYSIRYPDGRIGVSGHDRFARYAYDAGSVTTSDAGWFLAELRITGMGSDAGALRAYVNGRQSAAITDMDWSGLQIRDLVFAAPWLNDKRFVGQIDFDELAVTSYPPPTFLQALGPQVLPLNACQPYTLYVVSADGAIVPTYRSHVLGVQLVGDGSASLFADSSCTVPLGNPPTLQPGTTAYSFFIRATAAGTFTLTPSTGDLLGTSWTFTSSADAGISPDGGADSGTDAGAGSNDAGASTDGGAVLDDGGELGGAEPRELAVGCGCQSAPAFGVAVLIFAAAARRRRSR